MDHSNKLRLDFESIPEILPGLPTAIRYYDDFHDKLHSISAPEEQNVWPIYVGGGLLKLNFTSTHEDIRPIIKRCCAYLIQNLSAATAVIFLTSVHKCATQDVVRIVGSSPEQIRSVWQITFAKGYDVFCMRAMKSLLRYLCKFNIAPWSTEYLGFLSTLPLPSIDKYAAVRTGDVFLSAQEEATLVHFFDVMADEIIKKPEHISDAALISCSVLACSYQFGMRPMQIGMLRLNDIQIRNHDSDNIPSVHLKFKMVKQRSKRKSFDLVRKVKREWAPLFVALFNRMQAQNPDRSRNIFGVESATEIGRIISNATEELLPFSRSATDLRHTAAQRLADSGASQEELAEFMGHSDIDTALVYFETSPNQAERVNRALGISKIYTQVAKIAHDRFISLDELAALKGDQQIGGVPHGVPIAGIGGCSSGQPSCPYNPVTSCYGCHKFMPVSDIGIHEKVLADFRGVVSFFAESSRGDINSPAYQQLQRTLASVQGIISEIKAGEI